jgi:hypothetical protein
VCASGRCGCADVRKASGTLRHRVGDVHEVADHLVDVTDRHPDAVTALDGLGRFLAIVKNIDHYLSQVRFPPRAASLRREQGGPFTGEFRT